MKYRLTRLPFLGLGLCALSFALFLFRYNEKRSIQSDLQPGLAVAEARAQDDGAQDDGELSANNVNESQVAIEAHSDELRELLSLVSDRTLELKPREMKAYWKLVRAAEECNQADLHKLASSEVPLSELFLHPEMHRGEISSHRMIVRRVLKYQDGKNADGQDRFLYEVWGSTDNAKNWLYVLITPSLPNGFDEKSLLKKVATFTGFFFKLQAYQPIHAKSSDRPLLAPLFIGKIGDVSKRQHGPLLALRDGAVYYFLMLACFAILGAYVFAKVTLRSRSRGPRLDKVKVNIDEEWLNKVSVANGISDERAEKQS